MPRTYRNDNAALRERDAVVETIDAEVTERADEVLPVSLPDDEDATLSEVPPLETASVFDAGVSEEQRIRMIAEAAYYIAQRRDFEGGLELDDWLAAEAEVNARLASH